MSTEILAVNTNCFVQIEGEPKTIRGIVGYKVWMGHQMGWVYGMQLEDGRQMELPAACISVVTDLSEAAKCDFKCVEQVENKYYKVVSSPSSSVIGYPVNMDREAIAALLKKYDVDTLYYMALVEHVPSIMAKGIYCRNAAFKMDIMIKDCSDQIVQGYRQNRYFTDLKKNTHDFVPLYFCYDTPMRYVLFFGTQRKRAVVPLQDMVFFELSAVDVFMLQGRILCDRNASEKAALFFADIQSGLKHVDWDVIKRPLKMYEANFFYNKSRKQAEVLVPYHIPASTIRRVITYNDKIRQYVRGKYLGCLPKPSKTGRIDIEIMPKYYELEKQP